MKKLFLFSGLGVDERVFCKMDLSAYDVTHLKWIKPLKGEDLSEYAKRLVIDYDLVDSTLIGLSFGGIVAQEVAKHRRCGRVLLIASAMDNTEFAAHLKLVRKLKLYKLFPTQLLKVYSPLTAWIFGVKQKEHKKILKEVIADADLGFLRWAIKEIMNWKTGDSKTVRFRIHGTHDKIFPVIVESPNERIYTAGHFITVTHHDEVDKALRRLA